MLKWFTKYGFIIFITMMLPLCTHSQTLPYTLHVNFIDKDSSFKTDDLQLQKSFADKFACDNYILSLNVLLSSKGYATASVDSIWQIESASYINLFLGKKYVWIKLQPQGIEKRAIEESGYREKNFFGKFINMQQLAQVQQKILNYYENNGHPFAQVYLDSLVLNDDKIDAQLKVKQGVLYHIDSLRIIGKAKMNNFFLQHYLDITKASIYNKKKLQQISKLILDLPYIKETQPSDLTMLGSGSVLNLYLEPKKSSQLSAIVGFAPSTAQNSKLQITGDVNLNLKNALGNGESILLVWQQLQQKSPRLNLGYQQPYIFKSKFGVDFLFDLFKKDSSFLQVQAQLGLQYLLSGSQSGKIFIQSQNSFLLANGVDTNAVKFTKQLPPNVDVTAINIGLDYDFNKTDYKINPRSGNELKITTTVGIKNIKKNNDVISIKDPSFNYASLYDTIKAKSYQFKIKITAAHFFPLGKQGTFKTGINAGIYNSPNIFRNELFQIGGYRLLRGFNEESIFATQYGVGTLEYRYRLGLNSNLFAFVDVGLVKSKYQKVNTTNNFASTGLGMLFETKFGLLNISYALGKRNDVKFNIREASKIHFGYINYF